MALVPYAGTSARAGFVTITPVLTADTVTFTGTPVAQIACQSITISCSRVGEMPEAVTTESSSDAQGHLAPTIYRGGVLKWVIRIEGLFDQAESTALDHEPFGQMDIIFKKDSPGSQEGYGDVPGKIENWQANTGVTQGMAKCSFEFHVSGQLPAYATTN